LQIANEDNEAETSEAAMLSRRNFMLQIAFGSLAFAMPPFLHAEYPYLAQTKHERPRSEETPTMPLVKLRLELFGALFAENREH